MKTGSQAEISAYRAERKTAYKEKLQGRKAGLIFPFHITILLYSFLPTILGNSSENKHEKMGCHCTEPKWVSPDV